jgi:hypothetical protein
MKTDDYPIKAGSVLHRLLKMVAEEVAKEFSVKAPSKPTAEKARGKRIKKDKSK